MALNKPPRPTAASQAKATRKKRQVARQRSVMPPPANGDAIGLVERLLADKVLEAQLPKMAAGDLQRTARSVRTQNVPLPGKRQR